jgi:ATP adenylyltransferase
MFMEKLWSPWRSQYIDSFNSGKVKTNCVFCDAVNEDINNEKCLKVYDGELCFAMLNLYPYNSGHVLIIPKRHLSRFDTLEESELNEVMKISKIIMKALEKIMKPQGFNFGANIGKAAGAGIDDHIHFHVLPRWNGDTNFMPAIGEVKIISLDLINTKKQLIEAIKKL